MKKVFNAICIMVLCVAIFLGCTSCISINIYQDEPTQYEENPIVVSFDNLINNPHYYADKLIKLTTYVSSTEDYFSFQGICISNKDNVSDNHEADLLILEKQNYYDWTVMSVNTWEYIAEDLRLQVGEKITIIGYFKFRKNGENHDWYDGIVSAGDYGRIEAIEIIRSNDG